MRKIIASIDIGSSSIKLIVGEYLKNKMNILSVSEVFSDGIKEGFITDPDLVMDSLKTIFQKSADMLGIRVQKVIATIPSQHAVFQISEGKTTIGNEESLVRGIDMIRSMQAASYNKIGEEEELANIIPTSFKINETEIVDNPLGHTAETLTVKTILITVPKKNIYPIVKCLEKVGVEVVDISLGSLGDYAAVKTKEMDDTTGVIINVGKDTTTVSIFNKGIITNTSVLELGGQNIDNDLAFIYKITKEDAKILKEKLSLAHKRMASPSSSLELTNKLGENIKINQYEVSSVAGSRLEEILKLAKKQINLLTKKEIHYIMITGGVTEMPDFSILVEEIFGHTARIAEVTDVGARDNKYSSAVGLIKYYENKLKLRNKEYSIFSLEEQEELSGFGKKINFSENSILGKLFGYFFDN